MLQSGRGALNAASARDDPSRRPHFCQRAALVAMVGQPCPLAVAVHCFCEAQHEVETPRRGPNEVTATGRFVKAAHVHARRISPCSQAHAQHASAPSAARALNGTAPATAGPRCTTHARQSAARPCTPPTQRPPFGRARALAARPPPPAGPRKALTHYREGTCNFTRYSVLRSRILSTRARSGAPPGTRRGP
jgi:hypothetical protein